MPCGQGQFGPSLDEERCFTVCETDLCLYRHEECDTNLGLDKERDSTLCEADLCL